MAKNTQIVKKQGPVDLAKLEPWEVEAMEAAKKERAKEAAGMARLETSPVGFKADGNALGSTLKGAIADYVISRAFFKGAYVPGSHATPICYAYGEDEDTMAPHPQAPEPQCESCAKCPHNAFGTAEVGRGKRCKDTRSLGVVAEGLDGESALRAEVRSLSIPAGSLKAWRGFLKQIPEVTPSGNVRSVLVEFGVVPQEKAYGITFKILDPLPKAAFKALLDRKDAVRADLTQPWPTLEQEEQEAPKPSNKKRPKVQ